MLGYFRIFLLGLSFLVFTPIGLILCLIRPFNPDNLYFFAATWGPVAQKILGLNVNLMNHQIMKDSRPCVFIMNHQSNFDIVIGGAIRVRRTVSLGKKEILWFPVFGLFYWLSGNILIKREKRHKAIKAMNKVYKIIKEKSLSILIMPEGTRSKGKGLGKFKKGAFRTAIGAKVPVVPICVADWNKNVDLNSWNPGTLNINVLPKISTEQMTNDDIQDLSDTCHRLMKAEIDRLNQL